MLVPLIVIVVGFSTQYLLANRYDWECGACGRSFSISPVIAALMPHRFGGRSW
ncbi:hypothetical protein [Flexivirga caeni]|uniref:hypothetical protein n=1 Tax=Flexivirga caeni TaxID=2294115 RepID=UPI00131514CF|nr:hypothetical protein [Flexivirga caeni]